MPWKVSSVMEEKLRFVFEYERDEQSMTELCQRYQIARETGYVWLRRYRAAGAAGLAGPAADEVSAALALLGLAGTNAIPSLPISALTSGERGISFSPREKTPPLRPSGLGQAMFVRLAKAYNSPTLLKEIGLIYLRDFNLPDIALQHFERSVVLGRDAPRQVNAAPLE